MARIVKEPTARRNEILAVAQHLIYTKGYEQMTIQDILDILQISKGAFYHYFGSKQALLEALIERLQDEVEKVLSPLVDDPELGALVKLQRFFPQLSNWKTEHRTFLLTLMRVLYSDDNAIFRQKVRVRVIKRVTPLLATIIRQGIQEGVLTTTYPDQVGELLVSLGWDLGDTLAGLLLSSEPGRDDFPRALSTVAAYTDALERVLAAPSGSLSIIDPQMLQQWFVVPEEHA
ncbi:MAG TPA: TetR/AcrR family transcriptional regulator [Ktedonosporobacter sp.]|nr:TetR/AcrR family transcriptional regulator [Ktedonosporobacter sp.]